MITPREIAGKALRKYTDYLRSVIQGISLFPLYIPADKKGSADFAARHKELEGLIGASKERTGYGYSLEYKKVITRKHGEQDEVTAVFFEQEADYVRFLDKVAQTEDFKLTLEQLLQWRPVIKDWLLQQSPDILFQHKDGWNGICVVVDYLLSHDVAGHYLRTIPVPVHTKFIQRYSAVIYSLLKYLQPARFDKAAFGLEETLGLLKKPHLFMLRWLDDDCCKKYSAGMGVFGITIDYLKSVSWPVRRIILVENETNLFLLPALPGTFGLACGGGALHLLKEIPLFSNSLLYYWGDLDEKGFVLLHDMRLYYPHVKSLLMEDEVIAFHQDEMDSQPKHYRERELPALTTTEKSAYVFLSAHQGRIEQEKLNQAFLQERLLRLENEL
ncbi:MAG: hypothetical protein J7621_18405 [Niastella sp.]|nr:hypothetical protein [Niastella sp.]